MLYIQFAPPYRKEHKMSISTFNFQFYNYKLPAAVPVMAASSFSELEMDIDEEIASTPITSTPLPAAKQQPTPRFTSELALAITNPDVNSPKPLGKQLQALRPQLHKSQKRWSMELREMVLEMSKRNNGSDAEEQPAPQLDSTFSTNNEPEVASGNDETTRSVSDKINFFNKLTNTYESARSLGQNNNNNNNNRFISLLRSSRPMSVASTGASGPMPPPKPKRLGATPATDSVQHQFATPNAKLPPGHSNNTIQRKCSLRRKPSIEKSRATIARQNSNSTLRPQRHAIMEDLSLVVPVRLRIAEYEQRISMSA